jgi:processive 1,2-diacylglycerol beta-glucosyltransferase
LPGQEERNARVLVEAGAAVRTSETSELPAMLEAIFGDKDRQEKMIAAAGRLARPKAASEAASMIARLVQTDKEVVA